MENVCLLCNGLQTIHEYCPMCGEPLSDGGRVSDYVGPYSPYDEPLPTPAARLCTSAQPQCCHLVYCSRCGYDRHIYVDIVTL